MIEMSWTERQQAQLASSGRFAELNAETICSARRPPRRKRPRDPRPARRPAPASIATRFARWSRLFRRAAVRRNSPAAASRGWRRVRPRGGGRPGNRSRNRPSASRRGRAEHSGCSFGRPASPAPAMRAISSWISTAPAWSCAASARVLWVVLSQRSSRMARASSVSRAVPTRLAITGRDRRGRIRRSLQLPTAPTCGNRGRR